MQGSAWTFTVSDCLTLPRGQWSAGSVPYVHCKTDRKAGDKNGRRRQKCGKPQEKGLTAASGEKTDGERRLLGRPGWKAIIGRSEWLPWTSFPFGGLR